MDVPAVLDVVCRDLPYYLVSGGGLTLSGGEPFLQPDFSFALLKAAKEAGIHTCVETAGFVPWEYIERVLDYTDIFLYDYKETLPEKHREFTGQDNRRILENFDLLYASGADILLRCPLVPGCNDWPDNLDGILEMTKKYPRLRGVEIMPYHHLGKSKAENLGFPSVIDAAMTTPARKCQWRRYFDERGGAGILLS
jgi:pyruvate formate lyase activating enzyme